MRYNVHPHYDGICAAVNDRTGPLRGSQVEEVMCACALINWCT